MEERNDTVVDSQYEEYMPARSRRVIFVSLSVLVAAIMVVLLLDPPCKHEWKAATCTSPVICIKCGADRGNQLAHEYGNWVVTIQPTCTEVGLEVGTCLWCEDSSERTIPAIEHNLADCRTVLAPTCTTVGTEVGTCTMCGQEIEREMPKVDHELSDWIIDISNDMKGIRSQICVVCNETIKSEAYELTDEEKKTLYTAKCESIAYRTLERYPDDYKGELVVFSGRVLQVCSENNSSGGSSTYRVATYGWDNVVYVSINTFTLRNQVNGRILEDDYITFYGEAAGLYSYSSVGAGEITIPRVNAKYIDLR